ncbi:MAG: phosphatidylinositol mannoside acyltransferase [Actinomycetota bacterium]|nr:phosphatidylinositol mannoside acyltransferase [Actinomycetota bacterium]
MKQRLVTWAYVAGWALVRALPERAAAAAFRLGADVAYRRGGRGVQRLAANLRRVAPDLDEAGLQVLVRAGMRSYARYWLEVFRLPVMSRERIVSGARTVNADVLRAAHDDGKGVIVALPHTGNWDHAGAWAVLTGMPLTTVAERLEPAAVFDRFVAYREGLGMEVLPLTGGPRPPFEVLAERLRAGRLVCLMGDRDLSDRGIEVDFFGGRTRMPAGPALLALRTGAPLLPASLSFEGRDWGIRIHPPVVVPATGKVGDKVVAMTQQVADAFAEGIAEKPQDWHMLQRLWLDDLAAGDPRRVVPAVGEGG